MLPLHSSQMSKALLKAALVNSFLPCQPLKEDDGMGIGPHQRCTQWCLWSRCSWLTCLPFPALFIETTGAFPSWPWPKSVLPIVPWIQLGHPSYCRHSLIVVSEIDVLYNLWAHLWARTIRHLLASSMMYCNKTCTALTLFQSLLFLRPQTTRLLCHSQEYNVCGRLYDSNEFSYSDIKLSWCCTAMDNNLNIHRTW